MAFVHGSKTFISLDGNDLSPYGDASEFTRAGDVHDMTTYGKNSHVFRRGLKNATSKMSGKYDSSTSAGPRAIIEPLEDAGDPVAYIRRPEGTGSGLPQDSVDVIISNYVESNPVAEYITWSCDLQCTDDIDATPQA